MGKKTIVLAAFRVDTEKSVSYRKYKTVHGFIKGIFAVIRDYEPDYISVRLIDDDKIGE